MNAIEFLLRFFRRRMLLVMVLAIVALGGFIAADGWSWATTIFLLLALGAIVTFWALMAFWLSVVRGANRSRET